MSAAHMGSGLGRDRIRAGLRPTFDDFVRHMKRQGIPVSDRVMEAAHERATQRATEAAKAGGYRAVNFAPYAKSGLALARARFGYSGKPALDALGVGHFTAVTRPRRSSPRMTMAADVSSCWLVLHVARSRGRHGWSGARRLPA